MEGVALQSTVRRKEIWDVACWHFMNFVFNMLSLNVYNNLNCSILDQNSLVGHRPIVT